MYSLWLSGRLFIDPIIAAVFNSHYKVTTICHWRLTGYKIGPVSEIGNGRGAADGQKPNATSTLKELVNTTENAALSSDFDVDVMLSPCQYRGKSFCDGFVVADGQGSCRRNPPSFATLRI